jgi:hypothetical protein
MSKFLVVNDGDYTLKVQAGGEIRLDTGVSSGTVRITGDLIVEGDQTTINTQELDVEDSIIRVNKNDTTPGGVSSPGAGIEFYNGLGGGVANGGDDSTAPMFLFTKDFGHSYWVQGGSQIQNGTFILRSKSASTDLLGLRTHNINSDTGIIFEPGGLGTLRVVKVNYETFLSNDNDIPNKKYVDDEINAIVVGAAFPRITQGDSEIRIYDNSVSGVDTIIETKIDGVVKHSISNNYFDVSSTTINLNEVRIENNEISTNASNEDLVLSAPGTGSVKISDSMVITTRPSVLDPLADPVYSTEGTKLYAKAPGTGDSGLFFVNTTDKRDELISKQRALVFSHMF